MTTWPFSPLLDLRNDRVPAADADRQTRTATEILRRLAGQPGVVLADEVGMGKTYVALAVAVSVLEATGREHPIIVMVPPAVADKWPREWNVFAERCLATGHGVRATAATVRRGSDLLRLLDDAPDDRKHLIFMTHGALTSNLTDPFVRLALLQQATHDDLNRHGAIARRAADLLNDRRFAQPVVEQLLAVAPASWRATWNRASPDNQLDDDPVPAALVDALTRVDLTALREATDAVPAYQTATLQARLVRARGLLNRGLSDVWKASLRTLNVSLPLLILDEAHHVRNATQLAQQFANDGADERGPLGSMFERMLFLSATPFQLSHHELLRILDRFCGIRWPSTAEREHFNTQLGALGKALDRARASALRLERAWSRIDGSDASAVSGLSSFEPVAHQPESVRTALAAAGETRVDLQAAQQLLRPWVIRHRKPHRSKRRLYLAGQGIVDNTALTDVGLAVRGAAVLPFLLAARAEAVAGLTAANRLGPARGYFAYGLASSFEAYKDTRRNRADAIDAADSATTLGAPAQAPADPSSTQLDWYLARLERALPAETADEWAAHPKVAATVTRVVQLWRDGEKALVFCFYVETGRALRAHISRAIRNEIIDKAAAALGVHREDALNAVESIAERLLRADSRGYDAFRATVRQYAAGLDEETTAHVEEIAVRFMRTPSFLTRYVALAPDLSADGLIAGFEFKDGSGATFGDHIRAFASSLARLVDAERRELLAALTSIQTGGIAVTADHFDASERSLGRDVLMPNVRLANGGVRREIRQTLMLTFNTPFFPEVLIASSVMAEGVDLHQDCRHVIHHDLDWNPSTLEQRTGRVDRIGSKATRVGRPVVVYEPYLAGTHDEKMFRVVKDRERWFGVVMGETPTADEWSTERQAARVPLPDALAAVLTLDLALPEPVTPRLDQPPVSRFARFFRRPKPPSSPA